MDASDIKAVIGTNAWGSATYEKLMRGSVVDEATLAEAVKKARELGIPVFDTAQDYGLGRCQPMIGRLCGAGDVVSSKYTPMKGSYQKGQVRRSLERDLAEMRREAIDVYWLHLPNAIEGNLREMAALAHEGLVAHIGVANFTLEECRRAQEILADEGLPLFGVQDHYSLISRGWESEGLVEWCRRGGVQFWAWAVLEEGVLAGPRRQDEKWTVLKGIYGRRRRRLAALFDEMGHIGELHGLSVAQVAMAFVAAKGIVPICGCRKPGQVRQLHDAACARLSSGEVAALEQAADALGVQVFGKDIFRFLVRS